MKILGIRMNKPTFVRWKIYIDRARMYISYINFIMIAFIFINSIRDETLRSYIADYKWLIYPLVLIVFTAFSLILGRFDTKLGLRKEELKNVSEENPVLMEILKDVKEIKEKVE